MNLQAVTDKITIDNIKNNAITVNSLEEYDMIVASLSHQFELPLVILSVNNAQIRKLIHSCRYDKIKTWTIYKKAGKVINSVKCKNCSEFTKTINAVNACCKEEGGYNGCSSTHRYVECAYCGDKIYYFYNDLEKDPDHSIKDKYIPTIYMLCKLTNASYKKLLGKGLSVRKDNKQGSDDDMIVAHGHDL
jgi:hypothetical protein